MNLGKETIFAAIVGFAIGIVAAWAILGLPQFLPKKETTITTTNEFKQTQPSPTPQISLLTLTAPENDIIVQTPRVDISGKTSIGSTVVINGPLADEVIEATGDGSFVVSLDLEEGSNDIQVTAYGVNGSEKTETRMVNYTKEEF
ncbi:MAG: hypothetical protein V1858_02550 [Candidatus Gottesmanbacteria bacterium]